MPYLNKVQLIGRLGGDPTVTTMQSGTNRVSFSLATSHAIRNSNGERVERTEWHNIVGWGRIANLFNNLTVNKGSLVYIEGSLVHRTWTDDNGLVHKVTEVVMARIDVLSFAGNGNTNNYTYTRPNADVAASAQDDAMYDEGDVEDLPF